MHIGRRLPALLMPHMRVFRPGEPYHRLLLRFVGLHRERILAGHSMTAAQAPGGPGDRDSLRDFFQAWGRRPE